ncbi:MAG: hypothetical protein U1F77_05885 [Kiritimatiellia bacterium]
MSPVHHQSLTDAARRLRDAVMAAADDWRRGPEPRPRKVVRLDAPVSPVDPSAWLCGQVDDIRLLWSGKDERRITAGIGAADRIAGGEPATPARILERCLRDLPDHEDARAYGGFSFQPDSATDPAWRPFGPSCFWIPQVELVRDDNGTRLACNVLLDGEGTAGPESAARALDALREPDPARIPAPPCITGRVNHPDRELWG